MLIDLFKPRKKKNNFYNFSIGKTNLYIIELTAPKNEVIFNKIVQKIVLLNLELFFFNSFYEMELELDEYITDKNSDIFIIIY